MKDIKLTALIPPEILQRFQDGLSKFTGMAVLTTDENGVPVTEGSGFTDFCTNLTRKSPIGCRLCEECDKNGALQTFLNKKPAVYRCHAGLIDFASPIMVDGRVIGSIIGGQVRTGPIDTEYMSGIAKGLQIDPDVYISAAEKTSVLPMRTIEKAAEFLHEIAQLLSELAYTNYLALSQSRRLERAARSQSAYIMDMSLNMEKDVNDWMSIAKEAVNNGDKDVMETSIKELIGKSTNVYSMIGDTVDYIRMSGGNVYLNENVYSPIELLNQTTEDIKDNNSEKEMSLTVSSDETVPPFLLGDSGKIGQILNKLFLGCAAYSEKPDIAVNASCRKVSYALILDIVISARGLTVPEDVIEVVNNNLTNTSTDNAVNGHGESYFATSLINVLTKQISAAIAAEYGEKGESIFRLSIPQLEVEG